MPLLLPRRVAIVSSDGRPNIKGRFYAAALYKLMDDEAQEREVGGDKVRVWEGFLTHAVKTVGIPDGVYRRVFTLLEDTGCVQLISRGARGYPSMVVLLNPPTEDRLRSPQVLTRREDAATLLARTQEFIDSLGGLNIAEAVVNIEERLQALEARTSKLERGQNAKKSK